MYESIIDVFEDIKLQMLTKIFSKIKRFSNNSKSFMIYQKSKLLAENLSKHSNDKFSLDIFTTKIDK